ncbi:potassium-transporting ATPase subunit F [Cellulomonas sp. PS-H5]|nr:potassium-transporting ATPase subunit F [Cellulomonas sp. PS-H5]
MGLGPGNRPGSAGAAPTPGPAGAVRRLESPRAGPGARGGRGRPVRARERRRRGGREAVIVLDLVAAALGVAAVVYLVWALVKPERF